MHWNSFQLAVTLVVLAMYAGGTRRLRTARVGLASCHIVLGLHIG